jgi:hypothetical protein
MSPIPRSCWTSSAISSFGSAHDITLAELTIESFLPADAHTREFMQRLELPPQQA